MKHTRVRAWPILALPLGVFLAGAPADAACAPAAPAPLELTVFHVNDTHSMLDPSTVKLTLDVDTALRGKTVSVNLGGFSYLWSALTSLRAAAPNSLFLHAGDIFQGSLYFTRYQGAADVDFLSAMKLDAATLGNHEFDKGPALIQRALLGPAAFPVISANVDFSSEPAVTSTLPPYVIREVAGQEVGIIGLTTPSTRFISSPGGNVVFLDEAASVNTAVGALQARDVNKIILLTHLGYAEDQELARKVRGVGLIVGGHSHTLLGVYPSLGLRGAGEYPTVVTDASGQRTLIVQSWKWADQLGAITLRFDAAGRVTSFTARPVFVVDNDFARIDGLPDLAGERKNVQFEMADGRLSISEENGSGYSPVRQDAANPAGQYDAYAAVFRALEGRLASDPSVILVPPDPQGVAKLARYSAGVVELKKTIAATALEDLKRGLNTGPGPMIADSMTWRTGAQVAVMNPGGVRVDLLRGAISVARVYELQPFGDTLVTVSLSGSQLVRVLEDMADFSMAGYGTSPGRPLLYVSGITLELARSAPRGSRVRAVMVNRPDGGRVPLDPSGTYSLVVNSFMAAGGDRNVTLAGLPEKYDTGFVDNEALLAYIDGKKLSNSRERRVVLVP